LFACICALSAAVGWWVTDLDTPAGPPSGWHDSAGGGGIEEVACASPSWCVGIQPLGSQNAAWTWNGRKWTSASIPAYENYVALSCPTVGSCIALTSNGQSSRLVGGSWQLGGRYDAAASGPPYGGSSAAISCTAIDACVAVNAAGDEVTLGPKGWSAPVHVDDAALTGVSCPTASTCVAIDGEGRVLRATDGHFGSPYRVAPDALQAVACTADEFCAIADLAGDVRVGNPGRLGPPHQLGSSTEQPIALACPSEGMCIAAGPNGAISLLKADRWREVVKVPASYDDSTGFEGISCPSGRSDFCAVSDQFGDVLVGGAPFT
jgi:hypothetical protein